jgi:apolipoprotein N-acyltransferase
MSPLIPLLWALLSAVLLALIFPPYDFGFLAWFSLVPLFLAIRYTSLRFSLSLVFLTSMLSLMVIFYWINIPSGVRAHHYLIFGVYLTVFYILFGLLIHFITQRIDLPWAITAPPLWVTMEYLRSHADFMSFPWALLGHSQYTNLPVLQLAATTGVFGISFIIVMTNAAVTDWILSHRSEGKGVGGQQLKTSTALRMACAWAAVLLIFLTGWVFLRQAPSGKSLSLAVVQGNIPQEIKWDRAYRNFILSRYEDLSRTAAGTNPHLIVWPEAATPGMVLMDSPSFQRMVKLVREVKTYMLIGSAEYPKFDKILVRQVKSANTALFFSPEGRIQGQYLKIRLLPFGEYVPYEGIFPWPEALVPRGLKSDLAGKEQILFDLEGIKIGTLICSEAMYPELSRSLVRKGAGLLVNISNEAWFGKSAYPYQFLSLCVFRAVENRVNIARASNTGISCFIDPYGRVSDRVRNGDQDIFIAGTSTAAICLSPAGTFYTQHGDVFAWLCIVFSVGLMGWSIFKERPGGRTA